MVLLILWCASISDPFDRRQVLRTKTKGSATGPPQFRTAPYGVNQFTVTTHCNKAWLARLESAEVGLDVASSSKFEADSGRKFDKPGE